MSEPLAVVRTWDDLIEALRTAKALRNLSNESADALAGLTRGHVDKILGPSRAKKLSELTLNTFVELFGVEFHMVENPDSAARMRSRWEGRCNDHVRVEPNRVSAKLIERARPYVVRELTEEAAAIRAESQRAIDEAGDRITAALQIMRDLIDPAQFSSTTGAFAELAADPAPEVTAARTPLALVILEKLRA